MEREGHWDYMGRRLREERDMNNLFNETRRDDDLCSGVKVYQKAMQDIERNVEPEIFTKVDILKKEVFELQKSLNLAYIRIKELQFFNELSTESHYYKKECDIQLEFKF